MRRTVLSATALACTAVLAGTVPAFADGPSPVPAATAAPGDSPVPADAADPSPVPAESDASDPSAAPGGVTVVPSGAPDTGVVSEAAEPGADGALIGGSAAAVLAAGATVVLVRRRRANTA
ncbi:sortase-dependent protein [Streptomyces sp. NPDC126497]|uniref:sortase-dependent protein n=1 Tax=Streptomyces sp. NPDC126497 TaxID=3155313 RepID=UPI003322CF3F